MKRNERRKFWNSERLKRSNEVFPVPICGSRQLFVLRQLAVENQDKINNRLKEGYCQQEWQGTSAKNPNTPRPSASNGSKRREAETTRFGN
jgi:hypothetical protein